MNTVRMGLGKRPTAAGATLFALFLAGCSGLQIDVDVYKGPLANHETMQRDQLVSMAMSAKGMMYTRRNQLLDRVAPHWLLCLGAGHVSGPTHSNPRLRPLRADEWPTPTPTKPCGDEQARHAAATAAVAREDDPIAMAARANALTHMKDSEEQRVLQRARQLNAVLRAYEKRSAAGVDGDAGRTEAGIDDLADTYARSRDRAAELAGRTEGAEGAQALREAQRVTNNDFARLRHALVDMAARMHFLATNLWVIDAESKSDEIGVDKALIESVANNIIVHADDLQRRQQLESDQRSDFALGSERRAAQAAFAPGIEQSVRSLLSAIDSQRLAAKQAEDGASAKGAAVTEAEARLVAAKRTAEAAKGTREQKAQLTQGARELLAFAAETLANKGAPAPRPTEAASDARAVATLLNGDEKPVSLETLRAELARWLTTQAKEYESPALAGEPRGRRLRSALEFVEQQLKPMGDAATTLPARADAVQRFRERLIAAERQAGAALRAASDEEAKQAGALKSAQAALELAQSARALAARPGGPTADQLAVARATLEEYRAAVLADPASGAAGADMAQASATFDRLLRAAKAKPGAKSSELDNALQVLAGAAAPAALRSDTGAAQSTVDVQDDVIAQLRYRFLEALRRVGAEHADTKQSAAALEAAQRQREDAVYLRSAATFLRSAFAATALQTDPALDWRNMLFANATRSPRDFWNWSKRALLGSDDGYAGTRAALDKAYWQNVNSVRLSAAGSSNFVVAKDDVGNWYVKAMGSDASGMIRTATKLALFNLGGAYDSNLVRIDELRTQIANGEGGADAKTELGQLVGSRGGAAVAARGDTLGLFKQNYDTLAEQHRIALATKLENNALAEVLRERWAQTLKGTAQAGSFDALLQTAEVQSLQDDAASAAKPDAASKTPAAKAVLAALQLVQRLRVAIKSAVQASTAATADERAKIADERKAFAAQESAVSTAAAEELKSGEDLTRASQALNGARAKNDEPAIAVAQANFEAASQARTSRAAAKVAADRLLESRRKDLAAAEAALSAAGERQARAAADVDTVYKGEIERVVEQRLRVVDETETAVKIIGRRRQ